MPGITFTVNGDAKGFNKTMLTTEMAAKAWAARMKLNITKDLGEWQASGVAPNPLKMKMAGENAGKGFLAGFLAKFKGQGSGAASQLISVVSNTLSSLGSGMSPLRVLAQQGPNVAQAFVTLGQGMLTFILRLLPVVAGLAALGAGAFAVYKYFHNLSLGLENVANAYGLAKTSQEQLNAAMKEGSSATSDYQKWLRSIGSETMSVADKTNILLKAMREKYQMETQLAQKRGASPQTLLGMDLKQLKAEQDLIYRAQEKAYEMRKQHQSESDAANGNLTGKGNAAKIAQLGVAGTARDDAAKIVDLVRAETASDMKEYEGRSRDEKFQTITPSSDGRVVETTVGAEIDRLKNTVVNIDKDGLKFRGSLEQAEITFRAKAGDEEKLKKVQDDLRAILDKKKKLTEDDVKSIRSLSSQGSELERQIALKSQYGPQLAAIGMGGQGTLTDRERHGAASNGVGVSLVDIAKQSLAELKKLNAPGKVVSGTVGGVSFGQ